MEKEKKFLSLYFLFLKYDFLLHVKVKKKEKDASEETYRAKCGCFLIESYLKTNGKGGRPPERNLADV